MAHVTPVLLALRRMRAQPLVVAAVGFALAGAGALVGWSSLRAEAAQERSARARLAEVAPERRALHVVYHLVPDQADLASGKVEAFFRRFAPVTASSRRVRVFSPIAPGDERGVRLVVASTAKVVEGGRLPRGCDGRRCEAFALAGGYRLGQRVALGGGTVAVVVGRGALRGPWVDVGQRALLVASVGGPLGALLRYSGATVMASAALDPRAVHASDLRELHERLRRELVRLRRASPQLDANGPLRLLDDIADRGDVARERLLLVAGQAAALIVAFAAFAAATRRRETVLAAEQLATLGASRVQILVARLVEALVPALLAALVTLAGLGVAARLMDVALPLATALTVAGLIAGAAVLLFAAAGAAPRHRAGFGALEVAALTALGVLVWQTASSGALDPNQLVARETSPVLLLVPALAFFVAGVLLLRVLPFALRGAERIARGAPFGARLALLSAARRPTLAAAATTFLAVAVGTALFSLDYRETLVRQARDEARFTAGAPWRVRGEGLASGVPVLRLRTPQADVLAMPARSIPRVLGWRADFSGLSRSQVAARLRPRPVRLTGPPIAGDARALRLWTRATTGYPRIVVARFLTARGGRFLSVRVGVADRRWRRLRATLPAAARGAQLVGLQLTPTITPEPVGAYVELARLQQLRAARWEPVSLRDWEAADPHQALAARGFLTTWRTPGAPVPRALRFDLNQTSLPLVRPALKLPDALPALASDPVAAAAVDGLVGVQLRGLDLELRVIGGARRFPSMVERPSRFVVVDYDTLFAALNADRPGLAPPNEAWSFAAGMPRAPIDRVVGAARLQARSLGDPLAAGTREILGVAAWLAAVLGVASLLIATRSALASERALLAEYEALGVPPRTLSRSTQLSLVLLAALGVAAGVLGALVAIRLVGAFVAVTATATRPLLPIQTVVAWAGAASVLGAVTVASVATVAVLAARTLREPPTTRLRA
jgi:hypothetical protein